MKFSEFTTSSPLQSAHAFNAIAKLQSSREEEALKLVKQLKAVFQFKVSGVDGNGQKHQSVWTVDLRKGSGEIEEGDSKLKPTVAFELDDDVFVKMASGDLNPTQAFMSGKLKLKGNLAKALKFDAVFLKAYSAEIKERLADLQKQGLIRSKL